MQDRSAGGYHPVPGFHPPATRRSQRAVADILDAARGHLLDVGGLERFSLREVARRADYSPAAIYTHFGGVEALVNVLALESVQALGGYLERVPLDLPSPQRLMELGTAYLAFSAEEPARYRLAFATLAAPETSWQAYIQTAYPFTIIVDACARGLASGELVDREGVDASGLAFGLWSVVHGIAMLRAHHLAAINASESDRLTHSAIASAIAGITAPASPSKGSTS